MHKSYGSQLELNIKIKWKITNTHLKTYVCDVNHAKKLSVTTLAVCEIKLIYLHKYVHNHYKKE
jgi:hypothetical protein